MKLIIGTYRGPALVERALHSLARNLHGWSDLVIVDDSGNKEWLRHYRDLRLLTRAFGAPQDPIKTKSPTVIDVGKRGYNAAMNAVCEAAGDEAFMFWEEDFTLLRTTDLVRMRLQLEASPHLAQLALLRGPHFKNEIEVGDVLKALNRRIPGSVRPPNKLGIIEQTGTFTCNPAVWAPGVAASGWPAGEWSEDRKRDQLLSQGYRFGFLPGIAVAHDGKRSGFGY